MKQDQNLVAATFVTHSAEALLALRAEIEAEAALAAKRDEPFYRWLGRLAEEGRTMPLWNGRPNISVFARDMKMARNHMTRFGPLLEAWHPRLFEAVTGAPALPYRDPLLVAVAKGLEPKGKEDEALVSDLSTAHALASDRDRPVLEWMLARARAGLALPARGRQANMKAFAQMFGWSFDRAAQHKDLLAQWFDRFDPTAAGVLLRRRTLPGCDAIGTDVPTEHLLAALRPARDAAIDPDSRIMLDHLVSVASRDRLVPRVHGGAALEQVFRDAGLELKSRSAPAAKALDDWIEFFGLQPFETQKLWDGTVEKRELSRDRVARFLDGLRNDEDGQARKEPLRLRSTKRAPIGPSLPWLHRELNMPYKSLTRPEIRSLIDAYWEETGPGEPYEGISAGEQFMLNARRKDLLRFAKDELAAGRKLPAGRRPGWKLDYDEFVRRSGRPGVSVKHDDTFRAKLAELNPEYERVTDVGGVPVNYRQLIDGVTKARLANVSKSSMPATRSKINGAIRLFYTEVGKHDLSPIGDDFEPKRFAEIVDAAIKGGRIRQPAHWPAEMKSARSWLEARKSDDMLGDELDVALRAAVQRDGRPLGEIIAGIEGLESHHIHTWMSGRSMPSRQARHVLEPLALALGLPRDRLSRLLDPDSIGTSHRSEVKVPAGVHEFLPDDWPTRSVAEQKAMVAWIDENLVHSNTMFGHSMREVAARKRAAKAADADPNAECDVADIVESDPAADTGGPDETVNVPDPQDVLAKYLDKKIVPKVIKLGGRVAGELQALRHHMTVDFPRHHLRRKGGKWQSGSTAPMKLAAIMRFLRWQTLPTDQGGLGRDPDDLTLGDLVHPPLVFAYIDHRARALEHVEFDGVKRGKIFTSTEVDLLRTFASLVAPDYGLVRQRAELADRIVADQRPLPAGGFISLSGHVYNEQERRLEDGSGLNDDDFDDDDDDDQSGDDTADGDEDADFDFDEDDQAEQAQIMPSALAGLGGPDYAEACDRAYLAYDAACDHVDEEADSVRDPAEAIQPILDSPQPMTTLLRQLALAANRAPSRTKYELRHHLHMRDLLLVRLLALTSLRAKNLRQITVDGPRPKLSWDEASGRWLLQIHWREFKNYRNAVLFGRRKKRQPYRKWLPNSQDLYDLIRYYLDYSRPFLIKAAKAFWANKGKSLRAPVALFVTSRLRRLGKTGVSKIVRRFTARHIAWNPFRETGVPHCQPFGPHSFRDIRATDILLNPETANPFLEAAYALQTSPEMIQNHYGVVKVETRTASDDVSFLKREARAYAGLKD